ncbi:MAG: murein biosynthesis integral membrane protein MurJ [Clostridia bacterium]|nr:murein biosynthesis integral membrane protein MurJ [Clostridia bacterium]
MEKSLPSNGRKYGRVMLVLVVVSTLSKLFGFARDIVLSNAYGASIVADAYLSVLSISDMFLDLFAHTAMMGFVPLAIGKLNSSRDELNSFTTSVMKVLLSGALLFSLVLSLFPGMVINLLAPGFEGEQRALAMVFLRILSLTMLFRSVTSVFQSYLGTVKCFLPSAFLGITLDISVILAIIISKRYDLAYLLPVGVVIGTLLQTLLLLPFVLKKGFRLRRKAATVWSDIKSLLVMSIPAVLAVGLMQISTLFNKALASGMEVGAITMLNHSGKISFFVENIIVSSIATVLYPLLSEHHIKGEIQEIRDALGGAIDKLITFLLPASVGLALLSEPIIDLLFGHGEFTDENVKTTAILMVLQVIGILGIAVHTLLSRALFSMKRVKLSIVISLSLLAVFLGCSYLLSRVWGLYGIALATGVSYTAGGVVYYCVLNKICGGINARRTGITLVKSAISTALMALAVLAVTNFVPLEGAVNMFTAVIVGVIVYFVMANIVRLEQASVKSLAKSLFRRRA